MVRKEHPYKQFPSSLLNSVHTHIVSRFRRSNLRSGNCQSGSAILVTLTMVQAPTNAFWSNVAQNQGNLGLFGQTTLPFTRLIPVR